MARSSGIECPHQQYDANLAAVNSPLLSVHSTRSLRPLSASAAACVRLMASAAAEDHHPHVAEEVIEEVASSSQCGRCHPMHELEPFLGSETRPLGKGESPLLRQHTNITELLHMVKARQASHHLHGTKPLQGLEVKVPEALVPLPRLVVPMSSETKGLCHLHVEDIESICAFGYLGKKATTAVPNPHDPVLDLHVRTVLIQLSQADDRVPHCGDVVDYDEQPVLTRHSGEDDRADALDLHARGVPKLEEASNVGV